MSSQYYDIICPSEIISALFSYWLAFRVLANHVHDIVCRHCKFQGKISLLFIEVQNILLHLPFNNIVFHLFVDLQSRCPLFHLRTDQVGLCTLRLFYANNKLAETIIVWITAARSQDNIWIFIVLVNCH